MKSEVQTDIRPHASHWGAYGAVVEGGRVTAVRPFARDPSPARLIESVPDIVHAACRIDRPYVRKGWLEGDRAGGTPRGGEAFVPVDWDTAIRLCAEEVARVRDTHGPASIFGGSYGWSSAGRLHHARTLLHRMLGLSGGYTGQLTNYSYAAGMTLMPHVVGTNDIVQAKVTDWRAIAQHCRLMICFGGLPLKNGLVTAGGSGAHEYPGWLAHAAQAGVRFVNLSPLRQDAPEMLRAEWIPVRPGGDTALILAMLHVLVTEGLAKQDFLDRCTVGWDRLRAYVLGETDGVAKTPDWAAARTDMPAGTIVRLAREAAALPTMLTMTWSLQRAEGGEQPFWALAALAAALGWIGQPGCGLAYGYGSINGMGTPRRDVPSVSGPSVRNPANSWIPVARVTDMLEHPGEAYDYNGRRHTYPDTRLIWWAGGNPFHHHQDLNRLLRAWARAETVIVNEPWWTALARQADIVLPATTTLERNDIGSSSRDRFVMAMRQAIAPVGQARNDFDIFADIADALGIRPAFTEQRDEGAWLRHMYDRWRRACAQQGVETPDFETFWDAGHVEIEAPADPFTLFADFVRDPEAHPLNTPSGRIEVFSETIAAMGYDDCPGHPVWREPQEWLGAPDAGDRLHLLSFQPATRLHGQLDQGRVSLESKIQGREPILLHPEDAAARGIAAGDVVRVFNDRGACLAGVVLTDGIRRGVAAMATGAWLDPEQPGVPGSLCVHGNPNVLTRDVGTSRLGQGPVAQSCLVRVVRHEGPLPPVKVHAPPRIEA